MTAIVARSIGQADNVAQSYFLKRRSLYDALGLYLGASQRLQVFDGVDRSFVIETLDVDHDRQHAVRRLRENGVTVISVPDDTHEDGFTIDEYAIDDPTDTHHGNQRFGARMLERVLEFARTNVPASSGFA